MSQCPNLPTSNHVSTCSDSHIVTSNHVSIGESVLIRGFWVESDVSLSGIVSGLSLILV